jgi:hypothetical protein
MQKYFAWQWQGVGIARLDHCVAGDGLGRISNRLDAT